jgi:Flp pilus assembly pilin Flp
MLKSRQRGQGMTEYIIIVALIAVAAIGAFRFFGQTVRGQAAVAASELGGGGANTAAAKAVVLDATTGSVAEAARNKNLSNYDRGNTR